MNNPPGKSVSRETCDILELIALLKSDPVFNKSVALLEHRQSLRFNTDNSTFILFWLRALSDKGYLPLVVFERERDAEALYVDALSFIEAGRLSWLPLFPGNSPLHENPALENHLSRFLADLYTSSLHMIISSEKVFEQVVPDKEGLRKHMLHFRVGEDLVFSGLADRLSKMGYQRSNTAEYCGEFAVRGGIVDIYPYGETYPLRLEFFGDTVESYTKVQPRRSKFL